MTAFPESVVSAVVEHMNGDHADDSLLIVRAFVDRDATAASMIGLDSRAGVWTYTTADGEHEASVPWATEADDRVGIRTAVVDLYHRACDELGVPRREH